MNQKQNHYYECKCSFCGRIFFTKESKTKHEKVCKQNPNHIKFKGHPCSEEQRKRISESMKKAHAEGRAHNIGECRWNNEPSYPEKWFMEMANNEGLNPNYIHEFPFHKFSLDFAWVDLKKVIEIDGEQHQRDTKQKERDIEKDRLLAEEGWSEIRVSWDSICSNPKKWISAFKFFINGTKDETLDEYSTDSPIELSKELLNEHLYTKEKLNLEKIEKKKQINVERQEFIEKRKKYFDSIDTTKFGWITKAQKDLGISHSQIRRWIEKFYPEKITYKRKS